eukprot:gene7688-10458_t
MIFLDFIEEGASYKRTDDVNHHYEHIHIVVSRYMEDISSLKWISKYPHTVYNRGTSLHSSVFKLHGSIFKEELTRKNIGRESYIYLKHIINNYHSLAHVNVFIQADASRFPHHINSTALQENVIGLAEKTKYFNPLSDGFAFIGFDKNCMGMFPSSVDPSWDEWLNGQYHINWTHSLLHDSYKNVLNVSIENPRFWPSAMFAVTAKAILEKPVQYYESIIGHLDSNDPPFGHFLERAWPEVFSSNCSQHKTEFYCFLGQPDISC